MKNKLIESSILKFSDFTKEFNIKTDASTVGLGAVLCQNHLVDKKKIRFLVAYTSRSLSSTKYNYGITDLEGLAVV